MLYAWIGYIGMCSYEKMYYKAVARDGLLQSWLDLLAHFDSGFTAYTNDGTQQAVARCFLCTPLYGGIEMLQLVISELGENISEKG